MKISVSTLKGMYELYLADRGETIHESCEEEIHEGESLSEVDVAREYESRYCGTIFEE